MIARIAFVGYVCLISACGGSSPGSPAAPTPQIPNVVGNYSGTTQIVLPELGQSLWIRRSGRSSRRFLNQHRYCWLAAGLSQQSLNAAGRSANRFSIKADKLHEVADGRTVDRDSNCRRPEWGRVALASHGRRWRHRVRLLSRDLGAHRPGESSSTRAVNTIDTICAQGRFTISFVAG